jgi:NitT/TauT family transport system substrate-binding protein
MEKRFPIMMTQTRRQFLTTLSLAGAAGIVPAARLLAAERPLETTSVRILRFPGICIAPQYIAGELLRAEGFADIRYVDSGPRTELSAKVARGSADFTIDFAATAIRTIDNGGAVTVLGGVHSGCWQLFAKDEIHSLADLRGKSVGMQTAGDDRDPMLVVMAVHVGLDPGRDIHWVPSTDPSVRPLELFAEGKIDAFVAITPDSQELRARHIGGHVIFSNAVDPPWSQYFCCVLTGNRDYVRNNPVATKRVLRAILKAADLCAGEPARAARRLVEGGFTDQYDFAFQGLREVVYDKWRDYDAEDTLRFYALRLREAGLIKSSPQKIIADGTDWRFLNELKRELKA